MKNHYRYFQRGEKKPWIPVQDDNAEREARIEGGVRLTVLATNSQIGGLETGAVPKDLKYFGPMYFDIDHKGDLALAIDSARRLVATLEADYAVEPRDVQIFLSGSKGLHLFLDPVMFGLTRSVLRLPAVYREMAKQLYVSGVDMQVYSVRNAFRLVNVQRDDGKYRVQITHRELADLTPEKYKELVSAPRLDFLPPKPTGKQYALLTGLFQTATEIAKRLEKPIQDSSQVYAPILKQHFSEDYPPCVLHLAEGKRAENKSFNEAATQVAIFAARLDPDGLGKFKPVWERIADNQHSSSYANSRARLEHMDGQFHYMRVSQWNFSCNAMRSVLKSRVCSDCPLEAAKVIESPEDAATAVSLDVRADGYFDGSGKSPRRITTFVLRPEYVFNETTDDGQVRRVGTVARIESNGSNLGNVLLEESAWNNRSSFIRALQGYGNASYFGNDTDIQKLRFMIMSDPDLPEKTMTREMGMHIERQGDREIRTYVERKRSISNTKLMDTKVYEGDEELDPFLMRNNLTPVTGSDEEAIQAIKLLFGMNEMNIMAYTVGWSTACALKAHMMHLFRQFPLVNLWGNQGNGKTTLARYCLILSGTNFVSEHEEKNVAASTPYSWLVGLSNSASNAVLYDEVNKSGNRMTPQKYAQITELLKGCFNGQAASKGALTAGGAGIKVRHYRLLRPCLYCSEQQPDDPALLDRSISLLISARGLEGRDGVDRKLRSKLPGLQRIGYTLMVQALNTPTDTIAEMFNPILDSLPAKMRQRPRYSAAICILGLRWLGQVLTQRGVADKELDGLLEQAEDAIRTRCEEIATEESRRQVANAVDRVFAEIFEILDYGVQEQENVDARHSVPLLRAGVNFCVKSAGGNSMLYLDVRGAHTAYLRWAKMKNQTVILDDLTNFVKLAKEEDYVERMDRYPNILDGRFVYAINLVTAAERGLPTYYVERLADEF